MAGNSKKTIALIILDGYGVRQENSGNAVFAANTPVLDKLIKDHSSTLISASGLSVGLPEGQMGNSEVGHLNLGAGRIVYQDITRIDKSILDGDFFENEAFLKAIANCKKFNTAMHLVGLASDGGVHSHLNHLFALIKMCKDNGLKQVYIHAITDGRDVPPDSAAFYIEQIEKKIKEIGVGKIATVIGRFFFMDRDNRWERVEKGYNAMFSAVGTAAMSAKTGIEVAYASEKFDEFLEPIIVDGYKGVKENDSVIFFNFRSDRAREISRAILEKDFDLFNKAEGFKRVCMVGLTQYDENFKSILTAYGPKDIKNTLSEFLTKSGLTVSKVAETEKYAHVTFFFNGGVEQEFKGETRILVPSPKVKTYDLKPEMSAYEVAEVAAEQVGEVDVLVVNFANCDMVGHTGVFSAAVRAVEVVDECVGKIVNKVLALGGVALVTADHGNAEQMLAENGGAFTAHTTSPVPLIIVGGQKYDIKAGGTLANVAPTLIKLLGLKQPSEMDSSPLI